MSQEIIDFKLEQLAGQLDRLEHCIDKICDRIDLLEDDLSERTIRKRIISFLFALYPAIMFGLVILIGFDHNQISQTLDNSQTLIDSLAEIVSN